VTTALFSVPTFTLTFNSTTTAITRVVLQSPSQLTHRRRLACAATLGGVGKSSLRLLLLLRVWELLLLECNIGIRCDHSGWRDGVS
jgi:hypothetical protein